MSCVNLSVLKLEFSLNLDCEVYADFRCCSVGKCATSEVRKLWLMIEIGAQKQKAVKVGER